MEVIITEIASLTKDQLKSVFAAKGKANSNAVVVGGVRYAERRLSVVRFIGARNDDGLWHGAITFVVDRDADATAEYDFLTTGASEDGNYTYID